MTPEEPSRRSERRRKANKRYNADQFAELELGSDEEYIKPPQHHDSGEDEDFDALVAEENAPDVDDVFDATPTEPSEGEIEENSADDAVNSHLSSPDTTARIAPRKRKRLNEPEQSQGENQRFHSRLTSIPASITAKDKMMIYLLGSGEDQGQRHLASRSRYFDNITTPSRLSLGLSAFSVDREPTVTGAAWYRTARAAGSNRRSHQDLKGIDEARLGDQDCKERPVLLGSPDAPKLFRLDAHAPVTLNILEHDVGERTSASKSKRNGWLLNIGKPVEALAWSYRSGSTKQYLTVASNSCKDARERAKPGYPFVPSNASRSVIDIYEFMAETPEAMTSSKSSMQSVHTISTGRVPKRRMAIYAEGGEIKCLKWSPMEPLESSKGSEDHLGLLATVSTDGAVRVMDVSCPEDAQGTTFRTMPDIVFESKLADTVCTCVEWLSSSIIAVGCANGHIALWDLKERFDDQCEKNMASPNMYFQTVTGFITSLSNCLPSRPGMILVSNANGSSKLVQLPNYEADIVSSPSSRYGSPFIVWLDALQYAFTSPDLYETKGHCLRRFWTSTFICRQPSPALCGATSSMHSTMLVGCADGSVTIFNPLRRVLANRHFIGKDYRQTWFMHDWRRPRPKHAANGEANGTDTREVPAPEGVDKDRGSRDAQREMDYPDGLSRIISGWKVDGYKEPGASDSREAGGTSKKAGADHMVAARSAQDGTMFGTVYEEPSAVTVVAWNPNQCAGGWAAAGMADGLVVVEDLCYN